MPPKKKKEVVVEVPRVPVCINYRYKLLFIITRHGGVGVSTKREKGERVTVVTLCLDYSHVTIDSFMLRNEAVIVKPYSPYNDNL